MGKHTKRLRWTCPQCGEFTPDLHEGYCADCCVDNQAAVDAHNAALDAWERLTDRERGDRIRRAALKEAEG